MSGVITADVSYLAGASSNPNPDPHPHQVRKEAEKVKGGEDRVEEIIAAKMRDMNCVASVGAIKIPEHCIVNSRAHMSKCAAADDDGTNRKTSSCYLPSSCSPSPPYSPLTPY